MEGAEGDTIPGGEAAILIGYRAVGEMMVKHRRKKNRNFTALKQSTNIVLGTLADDTIVKADGPTLTQDFDVISTEVSFAIREGTAGQGPLEVGLAQSDLTVAEILECLVAEPTSQTDVPAIEHTKRKVRLYGAYRDIGDAQGNLLNDGRPIRKKMFVPVNDGQGMPAVWARNRSGAPLTTGAILECQITSFGYWK